MGRVKRVNHQPATKPRSVWNSYVFSFEDERHLERYIQYHQQAIIRLMDKVATLSVDGDTNENKESAYQIIYAGLEELLYFVERHFTKYFDQDAKAPDGYLELARKDARNNLKKLHKGLTLKLADPRLIELMLHPLKRIFKTNPQQDTTYRKVLYAKEIQKELFR